MMGNKASFHLAAPYLTLFILTALVYANTLPNQFIWDDKILIVDNYQIQSARLIPSLFTQPFFNPQDEAALSTSYYRPLISLSYAIEYALWGVRPFGYHITNVIAHCLNVLLFFHFFRYIFRENLTSRSPHNSVGSNLFERAPAHRNSEDCANKFAPTKICANSPITEQISSTAVVKVNRSEFAYPALLASLLYAVSPVHTNAVSYIAGRTDLFATFFFLGSLILYRSFRQSEISKGRLRLFGASVFFGLALLCKEAAVMLPFVIVMYDLCFTERFKGGFKWDTVTAYAPFAVVLALYFLLRATAVEGGAGFAIHSVSDLVYRLATIIKSVVLYWKLLLFPFRLSYDRSVEVVRSLAEPSFLISLAIFCISIVFLFRGWRRDKARFFCMMWFFLIFAPVSNLLPVFPTVASSRLYIGEHYIYLPSMGLFVLAGSLISTAFSGVERALKTFFG
ncbi:MAG: hypothetical protein HY801_04935, partial [Candidatus Lindowbacteria bacterium]|nr:hypothetical protein [Candidatus Lindowbacteria bacterium]